MNAQLAVVIRGTIARIRAQLRGQDTFAPNKSNNLQAAEIGIAPALLNARNAK
jgi:hypothetical protein